MFETSINTWEQDAPFFCVCPWTCYSIAVHGLSSFRLGFLFDDAQSRIKFFVGMTHIQVVVFRHLYSDLLTMYSILITVQEDSRVFSTSIVILEVFWRCFARWGKLSVQTSSDILYETHAFFTLPYIPDSRFQEQHPFSGRALRRLICIKILRDSQSTGILDPQILHYAM